MVLDFINWAFTLKGTFQDGSELFVTVHMEKRSLMVAVATFAMSTFGTLSLACQQEGLGRGVAVLRCCVSGRFSCRCL